MSLPLLFNKRFPGATLVSPTTDTGWATYLNGSRLFLPAATNYCTNPSFEIFTAGLANGWTETKTATGTPVYSEVGGRLGGSAQRIQYTGVAGDTPDKYLQIGSSSAVASFAPGDSAYESFYVKGATAGCTLYVHLVARTSVGAYLGQADQAVTLTNDWVRWAVLYSNLPANTSFVQSTVYVSGIGDGDTIDITIDDVLIEKSSVLTPYGDGFYSGWAWSSTPDASTSVRTVSSLVDPAGAYVVDASGTVFLRFVPLWAGNNGVLHEILSIRDSGDTADAVRIYKDTDNKVKLRLAGAGAKTIDSAAQSFAANSSHVLVARWKNGDEAGPVLDLNLDGTTVAQVVNDQTITVGKIVLGRGATNVGTSYLGPCGFAPSYKSDAWVTAIQANSGAAYSDLRALYRRFMSAGDLLLPLSQDGRGYLKTSGVGTQP